MKGAHLVPQGRQILRERYSAVEAVLDQRAQRPLSKSGLSVLLDDVDVSSIG